MHKHHITLKRNHSPQAFLSIQSLGTDALNAISSIPGVENPKIASETAELVRIQYDWKGEGKLQINDYLQKHGVEFADDV